MLLATVAAADGASSASAISASSPATRTGSGSGAGALTIVGAGPSTASTSASTVSTAATAALAVATVTSGWLGAGAATAAVVAATAGESALSAASSAPVRPSPAIRPPATIGNAAATQPCKAKAAPQASASLIFFWRSIALFMLRPVHAPCGIRFSCHRARPGPAGSRTRRANALRRGSAPLLARFPRLRRYTPCRKWRQAG